MILFKQIDVHESSPNSPENDIFKIIVNELYVVQLNLFYRHTHFCVNE